MALAYLLSPTFEIVNSAGKPATGGYLEVYVSGSRTKYYCASDFDGTLHPFRIPLDSLGSNIVLAEDGNAYDVYVYNRYGSLLMSRYGVVTGAGNLFRIVSGDGSIDVTWTDNGHIRTYDIRQAEDGEDLLDWFKGIGSSRIEDTTIYRPGSTSGTMEMGEYGPRAGGSQYYHATAHVQAVKTETEPYYDNVLVRFYARSSEGVLTLLESSSCIVDWSQGLTQEFDVSCDLNIASDCEICVSIEGQDVNAGGFELANLYLHRVYSGTPRIPSGVISRAEVESALEGKQDVIDDLSEIRAGAEAGATAVQPGDLSSYATKSEVTSGLAAKQDTLIAGDNITIEDNVISATGGGGGGGGTTYTAGEGINIQNDEISVDTDVIQEKLTAGDNITISGNTISASAAPQEQADWNQTDTSAVDFIKNKPTIPTFTSGQQAAIDSGINSTKVGAYDTHVADTTIHVTSTDKTNWNAKEDASNKKQSIDDSSTTDFPSSKAVADFVNSSVATATARFLGSFTLTDLGLTYGATNAQIATALDNHAWPSGTSPTNNDYVYVEIQDPQTTAIDDEVRRFKFNGTAWAYEYTLNNSSFTAAEKAAIDSGITSNLVTTYSGHVADSNIHVTSSDKTAWDAKQDAIDDLSDIRSGAAAGATSVQPGDLATVATSGSYNDLLNKPTIPAAQVQADWDQENTGAVDFVKNKPTIPVVDQTYGASSPNAQSGTAVADAISGVRQVPSTQSTDNGKVLGVTDANGTLGWVAKSGGGSGTVDQTYNASSTNAQSGTAVAGAIATVRQVPSTQSTDNGKVLGVTDANGTLGWVAQGGGGGGGTQVQTDWDETDTASPAYLLNKPGERSLTEGNCIGVSISESNLVIDFTTTAGITDIQVVTDLPANPVSTVLYLIPESTP